jgi:hypothetical protein
MIDLFKRDEKAVMETSTIVTMAIGIIVLAALVPTALETLFDVDTTNWSAGARAIWDVLPIVILAGLLVAFTVFKRRR